MSDHTRPNEAQAEYWSSSPGRKWLEHEHALDTTLSGVLDLLLEIASLGDGQAVVDIGCGTGASTLAAARRVGSGTVEGVDISEPLLQRARDRAAAAQVKNVVFTLADAQTHDFAASRYDVLISRMGMMFFADPVAAFVNLRRAMKRGGRVVFVAWASMDDNPWFLIPKAAAVARLGPAPAADPTAPGPLAFQDIDRIVGLLGRAGLSDARGQAIEVALTPPGTVEDAARLASRVGPAARVMKEHEGNEADQQAIEAAIAEAFRPFIDDNGAMCVPGVVTVFTAMRGPDS